MKTQRSLRVAAAVLCTALLMTATCSDPLEGVMVKPPTPGAPALKTGIGTLTASWEAVDFADSYNLYYAESRTRPETPSVPEIAGTSYTISGLTNGTTYYVWVQAVNSGGLSVVSGMAQIKVDLAAPAKPTLSPDNGSITVSWQAVALAESYNLYYAESGTRSESPTVSPISGTSWTISGLTNGTTYYVWVQAVNSGGVSAVSPVSSAAPRDIPRPSIGTELTAGQWKSNTISSSSQADYYYIMVTSGQTYTVRWNDANVGDGTKTSRVKVSAYRHDDNNTKFFTDATLGYTTGKNFTAHKDGWVMIRVIVYNYYGSYAVMVTNS